MTTLSQGHSTPTDYEKALQRRWDGLVGGS